MNDLATTLHDLLGRGFRKISEYSDSEMSKKKTPNKWSKKEILGHLIDSAINNLQRFTEMQFSDKPYIVRKYNQDELVKANKYQYANTAELTDLWLALNKQIVHVMAAQTEESLAFAIQLGGGEIKDLGYLMSDYIDHLDHHFQQISDNL